MTLTEVIQLYTPLGGLVLMAFWVGALSQRVKRAEQDITDLHENDQAGEEKRGPVYDRLTRVEVHQETMLKEFEGFRRDISGINRQLANLATHGGIKPFGPVA